jgi:hypothetical protein
MASSRASSASHRNYGSFDGVQPLPAGASFLRLLPPAVIHQNAPHGARSHREEVEAVTPLHVAILDQAQVSVGG